MGKSIKNANLVQRTGKVAFYRVKGESIYRRMEGFTSLSNAKNPKEYSRQYVDEDFERTDITGYSASISYAFDKYKNNAVLDDIVNITENELIGQDMVREILVVDMTTSNSSNGSVYTANAKIRQYSVIPDTDGDSTDCLTYSGTFKTRGELENCVAMSSDGWQTITEINKNAASTTAYCDEITVSDSTGIIGTSGGSLVSLNASTAETSVTIAANAVFTGAALTLMEGSTILEKGTGSISYTNSNFTATKEYILLSSVADSAKTYKITITKE